MNFCYDKKEIFFNVKNLFSNARKCFLILENQSSSILICKKSFSNIKKINDINFINNKFAILKMSSLFF